MIEPHRFIAESTDHDAWVEARRRYVTATEVRDAATPAGFQQAIQRRLHPEPFADNAFMEFGRRNEAWIAMWVKGETGVLPNRWLIEAEDNRFAATPDGISLDHREIAEIKTGGNPDYAKPPLKYRRQMNFQMYVTGADRCYYAFMLRTPDLMPAWMEPVGQWVDRDDDMIADLIDVGSRLIEETNALIY